MDPELEWAIKTGDIDGEEGVKQFIEKRGVDVNTKTSK